MTRIDVGFFQLQMHNYNIISLIEEITLSVADFIQNKELTIQFDTDTEEKILACDADKIERIMLNLLSNAIKFTPPGGRINVTVRDGGEKITVIVSDTGIGIPAEDLPRIFERFYRVDKARSRMLGGTGLGLAIARQIVELSGGAISIDSELGKGTEVVFTLPAAQLAEAGWN
jgi:signal transduction histidine kinase